MDQHSNSNASQQGLIPLASAGQGGDEAGAAADGPVVCNSCKQLLDETLDNTVVSFGKYLFHVDCFRCAKCQNLVEHNTNLLLLSDGSPVCENCSYICSVCKEPIHNEAIVTGDESYHADCFRCRSCSNKIEELIFAKTNQGIWCMACHNERVARTRKHAEAKRNRQARKEKEGGAASGSAREGGGRSREHRERERDREKRPGTGGSAADGAADRTVEFPQDAGHSHSHSHSHDQQHHPIRPLPPSPAPPPLPHSSSSFDGSSPSELPHRRAQTTPGEAPRHTPPYPLPPSHSNQSIASLSAAASPSNRPTTPLGQLAAQNAHAQSHSRRPSASSDGGAGGAKAGRRTSASQLRQEINASSSSATSDARRPSTESTRGGAERSDFQPYPLPESPRANGPLSPSMSDAQLAVTAGAAQSRNGSLSAPSGAGSGGVTDKAANRRSGFYGLATPASGDTAQQAEPTFAIQAPSPSQASPASRSTTPPPPGPNPQQHGSQSFLPDLHQSMSFYDPDTLLFLNHVGSAPSSPKVSGAGGSGLTASGSNKALPELARLGVNGGADDGEGDDGDMERLSPSPGPVDASGDEENEDVGIPGGRDLARKVRESIHLVKRESAGGEKGQGQGAGAAQLDVELVEMLLQELEGTKKEMKELRGKYNAFRRASRSAFEGFSLARDEYDKEVAARRDTERQMELLRAKFLEQAKRLAQVDQEQRTAENLKRQSKDLRTSVVGMEKHLSQLKTEVALSTAQIAELAALGKEDNKVADRTSAASAVQDEVAEALDARLEAIKDAHRDEVNALIAQRDDLLREVGELKQTRDAILAESQNLANQNVSLVEKNADASRQLDQLQETMARMQLMGSKSGGALPVNGRGGHVPTPSTSSLSSSQPSGAASARSPLATARVIGSPSELNDSFRFAKPEQVEVHSRSKGFKWGKGKSSASADASKANQQLPPVPAGAKSPVPPRAGSVDNGSGVRQHAFQQTSILRPVRCDYCGDKMWGLNEVRCTACGSYAHAKCAGYLSGGCHPGGHGHGAHSPHPDDTLNFTPTGPPMFGNDLVTQATSEGRDIPIAVTKCIEAVEAYGMAYEGIYRKTGGMGQTKLITQYFERGQEFDLQDRDKFNDIAAITSCMKNYFRSLPVPLFTHDLHEEFVSAAELSDADGRAKAIEQVLYKLPPVHFHTARLLFQHLNRVKALSVENKMTSANLGVVFGPTVLRSPVAAREWSDMGPKAKIVEILCDHAESLFSHPYPPQ
ncbi:hypothetical protein JCM10213_005981 [Rhodosporidiobolus nylandii]